MADYVVAAPAIPDGVGYFADGFNRPEGKSPPERYDFIDSRHVGEMGPYRRPGPVRSDFPGRFHPYLPRGPRKTLQPAAQFAEAFAKGLGLDANSSWFDLRFLRYYVPLGSTLHSDDLGLCSINGLNGNEMVEPFDGPAISSRVSFVFATDPVTTDSTKLYPGLREEALSLRRTRAMRQEYDVPEGSVEVDAEGAIMVYGHRMMHHAPESFWRPVGQILLEMRFPYDSAEGKASVLEHNSDPSGIVWPAGTSIDPSQPPGFDLRIGQSHELTEMQKAVRALMYEGIPGLDDYTINVAMVELPEQPQPKPQPTAFTAPISGPGFNSLPNNQRWTRNGPGGSVPL